MKKYLLGLFIVFVGILMSASAVFSESIHKPAINSVTVNESSSVTVGQGESLTTVVNATIHDGSSAANWRSTSIAIGDGDAVCYDNLDLSGNNATEDRSFTVTAPNSNNTYNVYVRAYNGGQDCTGEYGEYTLTDAITVGSGGGGEESSSVTVTIVKYINSEVATAENTNNASFPMHSSWTADNLGSGSGSYTLSSTGYNNSNPYYATTSDMDSGADYSTYEDADTTCDAEDMYALVGYSTGDSLEDAASAEQTTVVPSLTNITSNKYIIVWNKTCVPLPVHVSPADETVTTTALQTLIDWTDVSNWFSPITYMYQSAHLADINGDGSFVSPVYTSGSLSDSQIATPGTPEGVYYWHVKATDSAGNTSGWTNAWKLTVDNSDNNEEETPVCEATDVTQTIVSDETTMAGEVNASAVTPHPAWTSIPGATWIYNAVLNGLGSSDIGTKTFTKTFTISGTPLDSTLEVAADNMYTVSVNGDLLDTGTSGTDINNFSSADTWTIPASMLVYGDNTITFSVTNPAFNPANESEVYGDPNPAGLLFKITTHENDCVIPEDNGGGNEEDNNGGGYEVDNEEETPTYGNLLIKKIIANGDGSMTVSDFMIYVKQDGENVSGSPAVGSEEGTLYSDLPTGTYNVSEDEFVMVGGVGYTRHFDGDCDSSGVVTVTEGETSECTVTNTRFVHSGGSYTPPSSGGEVLGEQTENTNGGNSGNSEEDNNQQEGQGEVLGETTCSPYLTSYLRQGRKNDKGQVVLLQQFLNEHLGLTLIADGLFGKSTTAAVISFQEKYASEVLQPWAQFGLNSNHGTGYVYKTTKWKINDLKCPGSEAFPALP